MSIAPGAWLQMTTVLAMTMVVGAQLGRHLGRAVLLEVVLLGEGRAPHYHGTHSRPAARAAPPLALCTRAVQVNPRLLQAAEEALRPSGRPSAARCFHRVSKGFPIPIPLPFKRGPGEPGKGRAHGSRYFREKFWGKMQTVQQGL